MFKNKPHMSLPGPSPGCMLSAYECKQCFFRECITEPELLLKLFPPGIGLCLCSLYILVRDKLCSIAFPDLVRYRSWLVCTRRIGSTSVCCLEQVGHLFDELDLQ
eukprot:TRINITY_DN4379_c0_g1_i10.p1 TRINITY_DN4379_c0_g1~~TRINITY_DN4379_c0_g1_i10.p1  ORF type:complete len:105 (+),score=3.51 TRINITY_DN4379_c0_g1_i10:383-697(+)